MVGFERRITLQNVGDPDPPRWQQILLGTHPPTMERIGQALASLASRRRGQIRVPAARAHPPPLAR